MLTKFGLSILFLTVALAISTGPAKPSTRSADTSEIERGRYLVEEVAKCANDGLLRGLATRTVADIARRAEQLGKKH